jgi:hypothetical protein
MMTRILNEDLRDRTNRATDTTKFLTREVQSCRPIMQPSITRLLSSRYHRVNLLRLEEVTNPRCWINLSPNLCKKARCIRTDILKSIADPSDPAMEGQPAGGG